MTRRLERGKFIAALIGAAIAGHTQAAHAHDPGLSSVTLTQHASSGAFALVIDDAALPAARRAGARGCDASNVLDLTLDGTSLALDDLRCEAHDGHTAYAGRFALPRSGQLSVTLPLLAELPRGHRSFARAQDDGGRVLAQGLLEQGDQLRFAVVAAAAPRSGLWLLGAMLVAALGLAWLRRRLREGA